MSTLHKLIEGLPIKVISRDEVEVNGRIFGRDVYREYSERHIWNVYCRVIIALMDEQPAAERPNAWPDVLSDVPGALNALARRTDTLLEKLERLAKEVRK